MPTLESLYRQDPESLPFRMPVDPQLLCIPVCIPLQTTIINSVALTTTQYHVTTFWIPSSHKINILGYTMQLLCGSITILVLVKALLLLVA